MKQLLPLLSFCLISSSLGLAQSYSTSFPLTENPISEGGKWINGRTVGLDWNNVYTSGGFAGGVGPSSATYADPTAILAGSWGPTQTVQATVHVSKSGPYYQEVELHLRSSRSAHSATGYELDYGVDGSRAFYIGIVRWNGALGKFTGSSNHGPGAVCSYPRVGAGCTQVNGIAVKNGDVIKGTAVGSTISAYLNDTLIVQVVDSKYSGGAPGIGFDFGCNSTYGNFGFSQFSAVTTGSTGVRKR
jgi:hypothetical protein